jgi:hypothetical protein
MYQFGICNYCVNSENFDYLNIHALSVKLCYWQEIKGFLIGAFMIDKIDNMVNWLQRSLMSKVLFSAGVAIIILHHLGVFYLPVLIYQTVFLLVIYGLMHLLRTNKNL